MGRFSTHQLQLVVIEYEPDTGPIVIATGTILKSGKNASNSKEKVSTAAVNKAIQMREVELLEQKKREEAEKKATREANKLCAEEAREQAVSRAKEARKTPKDTPPLNGGIKKDYYMQQTQAIFQDKTIKPFLETLLQHTQNKYKITGGIARRIQGLENLVHDCDFDLRFEFENRQELYKALSKILALEEVDLITSEKFRAIEAPAFQDLSKSYFIIPKLTFEIAGVERELDITLVVHGSPKRTRLSCHDYYVECTDDGNEIGSNISQDGSDYPDFSIIAEQNNSSFFFLLKVHIENLRRYDIYGGNKTNYLTNMDQYLKSLDQAFCCNPSDVKVSFFYNNHGELSATTFIQELEKMVKGKHFCFDKDIILSFFDELEIILREQQTDEYHFQHFDKLETFISGIQHELKNGLEENHKSHYWRDTVSAGSNGINAAGLL